MPFEIKIDFEIPEEIKNDLQWKNPELNLIRGFILTKAIMIERDIDSLILCIMFNNKKEKEKYYEKNLGNLTFNSKIDKLLTILQVMKEEEVKNKLEIVLNEIREVRNRMAHDNWQIITSSIIVIKSKKFTIVNAKVIENFLKCCRNANYLLTKLYHKYGGFDTIK